MNTTNNTQSKNQTEPIKNEMSSIELVFMKLRASYKPKMFNRREAYKLLGFKKVKDLTDWLKDNDFIDGYNYPCLYALERKLMDVDYRYVAPKGEKYDYDGSRLTKSFACPLFTQKGIDFFSELLKSPDQLEKVLSEIRDDEQDYPLRRLVE